MPRGIEVLASHRFAGRAGGQLDRRAGADSDYKLDGALAEKPRGAEFTFWKSGGSRLARL